MNPILAAELTAIQTEAVAAALDKTCVIKRATVQAADTYGSHTKTYTTVATVMAGMSEPTAGQLANYDFMIGSLAAWQIHFAVGTDVQHQDQLLIDGETLEVNVILKPRSYQILLTVLASEIK